LTRCGGLSCEDGEVPDPSVDPDDPSFVYEEFSHLGENCAEFGLEPPEDVAVARVEHRLDDGRTLSGLRWGSSSPLVVLVHGGAQNAHTWDTVALALRPVPILAIDLPGHGRSSWRRDADYGPRRNADDLAAMLRRSAPEAEVVVGMSLGGLTVTALAARHPELVRRLVVVDITPGVTRDKASEIHAFIEGPQHFGSFAEIFDRTLEFNPTRSPESLRRGILHNAHRMDSGGWEWNYDRRRLDAEVDGGTTHEELWNDVAAVRVPYLLVRGARSSTTMTWLSSSGCNPTPGWWWCQRRVTVCKGTALSNSQPFSGTNWRARTDRRGENQSRVENQPTAVSSTH
jgi:esterase